MQVSAELWLAMLLERLPLQAVLEIWLQVLQTTLHRPQIIKVGINCLTEKTNSPTFYVYSLYAQKGIEVILFLIL